MVPFACKSKWGGVGTSISVYFQMTSPKNAGLYGAEHVNESDSVQINMIM